MSPILDSDPEEALFELISMPDQFRLKVTDLNLPSDLKRLVLGEGGKQRLLAPNYASIPPYVCAYNQCSFALYAISPKRPQLSVRSQVQMLALSPEPSSRQFLTKQNDLLLFCKEMHASELPWKRARPPTCMHASLVALFRPFLSATRFFDCLHFLNPPATCNP